MSRLLPALLVLAATAAGVTGYALEGRPGLAAAPAPPPTAAEGAADARERARATLLADPTDVEAWIRLSNAFIAAGETGKAVEAMEVATAALPQDVNLRVQQGVALVAHAEGEVVPAARLAFDRASQLDPTHPAPRYFLGLAWLQAGRPKEALAVWRELAAMTPPDAPWAEELTRMIGAAETMAFLGVGERAMPPEAAAPAGGGAR
ncbi:MAG: tetratricopeptide repeat protein [Thermaurantiacus tibetensis]|uniref:tetratricopeptide repeat protein n=1 Tax=Thermaurantiacus tibetensis TaxID=2759035 RepID=UPI00188FA125|nr:tetratricopeptide repeat protein [Thermaurantiacus tibetensis]